jgi:hypothetical protein
MYSTNGAYDDDIEGFKLELIVNTAGVYAAVPIQKAAVRLNVLNCYIQIITGRQKYGVRDLSS